MQEKVYIPTTTSGQKPIKNYSKCNEQSVDLHKFSHPKRPNCLMRRMYLLTWINEYNRELAVADLIAGITLGLTIIPQSIAYAALAGLSSEYGLYSAFIGSVIYVFFGTIPQVSIGPTSLMSLMVLQFCTDKPVQFVIVLTFLAGLVELLMGLFELGFIVNFIPNSVNKAFTTATAMIIVLSQIKNLFGVKLQGVPSMNSFWESINVGDTVLGVVCIIVLLLLKQVSQLKFKTSTPAKKYLKTFLWYMSISRNALVVFICAVTSYIWIENRSKEAIPYALSASAAKAEISIHLPPFAFEYNNTTYMFIDICRELGSAIIVVPLVAVLANVAIAKAFVKDGKLDASQEMLTLGLCNLVGSFFSAMPTCGAFTRSAVSQASGVRTPMSGIYVGLIVFSALSVLTPYFQYIPKATLSAVLIAAVVFMMDFSICKEYWRNNKKDFFSWTCSFIVCVLVGVEAGLFFGIIINMVLILIRLGLPKLDITIKQIDGFSYVHIWCKSDIYYTGVEHLRMKIREVCDHYGYNFPVVVDCSRFFHFDCNFVDMIVAVTKDLNKQNVPLILHNLKLDKRQLLAIDKPTLKFSNDELSSEDFIINISNETEEE